MQELDFLSVWEREVWKKRIAFLIAFIFFLISFVLLLSSGERKTEKDKVIEYIVCRLNYTPEEVDRAYLNCPYQYKGLGYDTATEAERMEIRQRGLISFFYPSSVDYDMGRRVWVIKGRRLIATWNGNFQIKGVSVYVVKNKGFLVERIDEQ